MSKQIPLQAQRFRVRERRRAGRRLVLLLSLSTVLTLTISLTSAQRPAQGTDATGAAARNAALVAATNEVLAETSELRQLPILRPVHSSAQSRAEIERMIMSNLDRETTPAEMHAAEATLKKLGLAPASFQFRSLLVRLLTEQVAGYYDPKAQQFHLADWIDIDGQKPIMAHELTHALQDQHFNLRRFEKWPKDDGDAELAAHALIEGDATLAMTQYVSNNTLRALAFLKSLGSTGLATEELDKAPRALRETLLFPYQEGLIFTRAVHRYGGWADVSKAFTALPQSTEQILHPEKYFVHDTPVKVTLPDVVSLLKLRGWRRLDTDVNGEWSTYLVLDQFLKSPAESRRAAAGWGGDRYAVYENRRGDVLYASLWAWDTERDAREFFDAYVKRTQLRYANATEVTTDLIRRNRDARSWKTLEGGVAISLQGTQVLVAEGVPRTVDSKSLMSLLGRKQ